MSRHQRQTPRKPATKFAHLRKKLAQQKLPSKPQPPVPKKKPPKQK